MSKIKFTFDFERLATINTSRGPKAVGKVIEYKQYEDGHVDLTIDIDPDLPPEVRDAIVKNPCILSITGIPKPVTNLLLIE